MKKFVVMLKDKKAGELTQELLFRHIEHLRKMNDAGKLFLCGPFNDNDKAMQIILCESLGEVINLVESDPFVIEGYYAAYEVNEWLEANEENNWLIDIPQTKNNLT